MLKVAMSKIKKICSIALIPRILRDEVSLSPRKLGKRPIDGLWKMSKSTDSKDRDAQCEKCKKLIEMVFGPEKPDSVIKNVEANIEDVNFDKIQKAIAPNIPLNSNSNEPDSLKTTSLLPVKDTEKEIDQKETISINETILQTTEKPLPLNDILRSTTAKTEEEHLAQKIETIEEPGFVENTKPKIDGCNTKVLGSKANINEKESLCTKIAPEYDAMDEIAKKCLGSPPDKIDERILEEMKSCGMLGRGRRKPTSRRSGHHHKKTDEKKPLSEEGQKSHLYLLGQQKPIEPLHDHPRIRSENMKFAREIQKAYFNNIPLNLVEKANSVRESFRKSSNMNVIPTENKGDEKPELQKVTTSESTKMGDVSDHKTDHLYNFKNEEPRKVLGDTITNEEQAQETKENLRAGVKDLRVTAADTNRLSVPGETECELNVDHRPNKPEVLTCNQILQATETQLDEKTYEPDNREHVVYADPNSLTDSPLDAPDQEFNIRNTAISGTHPQIESDPEPKTLQNTAISSVQDPAEFYEISHSYMGEENLEWINDKYAINPSTIRPIVAYQPYTILSSAEEVIESECISFSTKGRLENENLDLHSDQYAINPSTTRPIAAYNPYTIIPEEVSESECILLATKDTLNVLTPDLETPVQVEVQGEPKTVNKSISATLGPLPELKEPDEEISLTEMLRRVRERNRLQYIRECDAKALQLEPAEANKNQPPCPGKGPPKTLGPQPCKPKPKPCPPPPPTCPPKEENPCKPKNPCAKFTKSSLIIDKIKETFTLVLQVGFKPCTTHVLNCKRNIKAEEPLNEILTNEDCHRIEKLSCFLLSTRHMRNMIVSANNDVTLVRDFEPWSPMPSWPIPEKPKKEPFVCPKEGCKIIPPPRLNPPCKENPCINLPKRKISKFSPINFEYETLYSTTFQDKYEL